MSQSIWCGVHHRTHRMTPSALERVIYALQAKIIEVSMLVPDEVEEICPEQILHEAGDSKRFRDYVDALVKCRLGRDGAHRRRTGRRTP
jgi:hypothetical protein